MKIKIGDYVKLSEEDNCGCDDCVLACSDYHKVVGIERYTLRLDGCGLFDLECDFHVKVKSLENK